MEEIWRDIDGYEGLSQISNKGRVKSLKWGKERILKPLINSSGYLKVGLCKNGRVDQLQLHRLVAESFIANPENKPQVNHKDENKLNNCVNNLEWSTAKENSNYGSRNERLSRKILQYSKSGEFIKEWPGALEVERELNINHSNIAACCKCKRNFAGGFVWRYKEKD